MDMWKQYCIAQLLNEVQKDEEVSPTPQYTEYLKRRCSDMIYELITQSHCPKIYDKPCEWCLHCDRK